MNNKLSHSAMNKYQDCAKSYEYRYIKRIVSKYKSGALYFGSALDDALNELLENGPENAHDVFDKKWYAQPDNEYQVITLQDNEEILYSATDFDKDLLQKSDWAKLYQMAEQLELPKDPAGNVKNIAVSKKEKGWPNLSSKERKFYNYANWLSMSRKGHLMLDAYVEKVLPKIKRTISVQKYVKIKNSTDDLVRGYIDAVVEWEDGSVVLIDNKTSSIEYTKESVKNSPQLSLYKMILDRDPEWTQPIDKCGYVVLRKGIKKDITKVCGSCGYTAEKGSRHKTCNNEVDGTRCGGEWDRSVKFDVDVQIIIDKIPEIMQNMVVSNMTAINESIKTNIFPRNFNACKKPWGLCEYYSKCWHNKMDDLIELGDRDERK